MGTHQRYYLTVTVPLPRPAMEVQADAVETGGIHPRHRALGQ